MVLCVQDNRFGEVKMPGGMSEAVSDGREETPEETMRREAISETGVQVLNARMVLKESRTKHDRYFFMATEVSGLPDLDSPPRLVTEKNPRGGSVEQLTCYWLPLRDFARRLFPAQYTAFGQVLNELSMDPKIGQAFCMAYVDLLNRFATS
jgi:ADP-ribose pyrophosphatase YjhB (NUDIX family)